MSERTEGMEGTHSKPASSIIGEVDRFFSDWNLPTERAVIKTFRIVSALGR